MARMPIKYRKAHCCAHCRSARKARKKRGFLRRAATIVWCLILGCEVTPLHQCSRFRWAAGFKPPKPVKAAEEVRGD